MIDTDKYEGHTPIEKWLLKGHPYSNMNFNHVRIGNYEGHTEDMLLLNVDANLVVDAPLLLAEVKRLQLWSDRIREYFRPEDMMDFYDWLVDEHGEHDEDREYDEGE